MPDTKADSCVTVVRGKHHDGEDLVVIAGIFTEVDLGIVREAAEVYRESSATWLRVVILRGTAWSPAQLLSPSFLADIRLHAPGALVADIHTHGDVPKGWR